MDSALFDCKRLLKIDPPAITEAAVWERIGGDPMPLLDTGEGRERLARIYGEYADAAARADLPIILFAPTWRANRDRAKASVNAAALDFVRRFSRNVGALMGPRGDCYSPAAALTRDDARQFHRWQAEQLAAAEFVLVSTMPAVSEALGIADVLPVPCLVSFVITAEGKLLDGTPLAEAIARIDDEALHTPLGYWINCVHPETVLHGLEALGDSPAIGRIAGVQGNTSRRDPRWFSQTVDFEADSVSGFADGMAGIHRRFSIPILGGCCGTRSAHIEALAQRLRS